MKYRIIKNISLEWIQIILIALAGHRMGFRKMDLVVITLCLAWAMNVTTIRSKYFS